MGVVGVNPMSQNHSHPLNLLSSPSTYQQALVISQNGGERARTGETLSNMGYLFERQNQPELAIIFFKQLNAQAQIIDNFNKYQ